MQAVKRKNIKKSARMAVERGSVTAVADPGGNILSFAGREGAIYT